jgi:transposase
MLADGLTRSQIAKALHVKVKTIQFWLAGHPPFVRRLWTDEETKTFLRLRAEGKIWGEISRLMGRGETTIRDSLQRRGIVPPRGPVRGRPPKKKEEVIPDIYTKRVATRFVIPTQADMERMRHQ